jgi:SMI1/KNR4 family protein SUKH-1
MTDWRPFGEGRQPWGRRGGEYGSAAAGASSLLDWALRRLEMLSGRAAVDASVSGQGVFDAPRLCCALNPPAPPDAIAEAELRLGTALPADYVQFLLHCDGAALVLDNGGSSEPSAAADLLGASALVRHAEEMEYDYRSWCIPELVIFATIGSDGDHLAFETGRMNPFGGCGVLDARHDYRPDQWWVIARDFTSWLGAVLADPGAVSDFGRRWDAAFPETQPVLPLQDPDRLPHTAS